MTFVSLWNLTTAGTWIIMAELMRSLRHSTDINYPAFFREWPWLHRFDEDIWRIAEADRLKDGPNDPFLPVSMFLYNSLLLSVGRAYDLPLSDR